MSCGVFLFLLFSSPLRDKGNTSNYLYHVPLGRKVFFKFCFYTEGVVLCGSQLYVRVSILTSYPFWPQDPCIQCTLFTRIQVLGHWGFSDGFSQMPALELIYYMDSYFPILPSLLELLLLSSQFSHALEKDFYFFSFVLFYPKFCVLHS